MHLVDGVRPTPRGGPRHIEAFGALEPEVGAVHPVEELVALLGPVPVMHRRTERRLC